MKPNATAFLRCGKCKSIIDICEHCGEELQRDTKIYCDQTGQHYHEGCTE